MTVNEWIEKYGTKEMTTPNDPALCLDELRSSCIPQGVYFYGAGAVANTFVNMFEQLGITVKALFDRDPTKQLKGYPVYTPDKLCELVHKGDVLIATVNWRNQELVRNFLHDENITIELLDGSLMHSPLQRSFCALRNKNRERIAYEECPNCFIERNYCDLLKDNILINKPDVELNKGGSKLPLIGVICGNICTLRCKHCVECIPYSRIDRHFEPADKLLKAIKRVAKAIEFVTTIDFVGGEPFLHPDLPMIINEVHKIPNVGIISIFTNGTVSPKSDLIQALKHNYVIVTVADYSKNLTNDLRRRIEKTVQLLKEENVMFTHIKNMTWFDLSSFKKIAIPKKNWLNVFMTAELAIVIDYMTINYFDVGICIKGM